MDISEIRQWDGGLFPDLQALMKELSERRTVTEGMLQAVVEDPGSHLYVLRAPDGRIAGCATLCIYQSPTGRKGSVEDVVVLSAFRGQGLGRRLMEHVLSEARKYSPIELHLTSRPSRVAANALYQALGFTRRETNAYGLTLRARDGQNWK